MRTALRNNKAKEIRKYLPVYFMMVPGLLFYLVFAYIPMPGIIIAFLDYVPWYGVFGSEFVGLKHFINTFRSPFFGSLVFNTVWIAILKIVFMQVSSILFAILVNEVRNKYYKKIIQSVSILPYFISWMVVSAIFYVLFGNDYAVVNKIMELFGLERINWYRAPEVWRTLIVGSTVWKGVGYQAIIYLASIVSIDAALFESAQIDGAGRFRRILHITIPSIFPTISVMTILAMGSIIKGDFGQIYALVGDNALLYPTVDVLDTFIFRNAFQMGEFSIPAAIGLFQSLVGLFFVILTNWFAKKVGEQNIW